MIFAVTMVVAALTATSLHAADDGWATITSPMLQRYCWQCHGDQKQKGDLNLQAVRSRDELAPRVAAMLERINGEEMPPPKALQPSSAERAALVAWLRSAQAGPGGTPEDPGSVVMPRMTPTQYERAIADLTGVPLDLASQLPHDGGAGEGFDNVGSAQGMSPVHLQAYMSAARDVVSHAYILPGLPIDWRSNSLGNPLTTAQLHEELMGDWKRCFQNAASFEINRHEQALAPDYPAPDRWQKVNTYFYLFTLEWLIPYMDAAWQYRYRASLGHPDWTIDDVADHFQPPLHREVLENIVPELPVGASSQARNIYWQAISRQWEALPPPPATDKEILEGCFRIMSYFNLHSALIGGDNLFTDEIVQPFEIDPKSWLPGVNEIRTIMMEQGRHPMRLNLRGMTDVYLLTTDANDGSDDDVMIWEHGVLERNGHNEPWTSLAVTDLVGSPVAWGSHPMGPKAGLPADSIAVHAPAVLHLKIPAGTTGLRVDARADPDYAKNGSMQVEPLNHPPSGETLHFVPMRYVFGATGSSRYLTHLSSATEIYFNVRAISQAINGREFNSLLPTEVLARWKDKPDHGHDHRYAYEPDDAVCPFTATNEVPPASGEDRPRTASGTCRACGTRTTRCFSPTCPRYLSNTCGRFPRSCSAPSSNATCWQNSCAHIAATKPRIRRQRWRSCR